MIGLLRSELLRARSRRVVWMLGAAVLIAVTVGITIAIFTARVPTQAEIDRGRQRYERELERCMNGRYGTPEETGYGSFEEMCAEFVGVYGPQVPTYADMPSILQNAAFMVLLLGAVLGATLGGADWSTGSITTLLSFEPRRIRILVMRTIAVAVAVVVMTVFAQAVLMAGFAVFAAFRGTFDGRPDGFAGDLAVTVLRIAAVASLFGMMGLALATIGRSTVAGLGVLLGYLIIVEGFLSNLVFWIQKVTFGRSAAVAITDQPLELYDASTDPFTTFILEPEQAWLTLGLWALGLLVIAGVLFRVRDVT